MTTTNLCVIIEVITTIRTLLLRADDELGRRNFECFLEVNVNRTVMIETKEKIYLLFDGSDKLHIVANITYHHPTKQIFTISGEDIVVDSDILL